MKGRHCPRRSRRSSPSLPRRQRSGCPARLTQGPVWSGSTILRPIPLGGGYRRGRRCGGSHRRPRLSRCAQVRCRWGPRWRAPMIPHCDTRNAAARSSSPRTRCAGFRCRRVLCRSASPSSSSSHRPLRWSMTSRSWLRTAGTQRSRNRCRSSGASLRRLPLRSPSHSRGCRLARPSPSLQVHRLSPWTSACHRIGSRRRCAPGRCHPVRCSDTCRRTNIRPRSRPSTRSHRTERTPSPTVACHGRRYAACSRCLRRLRLTSRCSGCPGRGRWFSSMRILQGPGGRTQGTSRKCRSMRREGRQWSRSRAILPSRRPLCTSPRSHPRCWMTMFR